MKRHDFSTFEVENSGPNLSQPNKPRNYPISLLFSSIFSFPCFHVVWKKADFVKKERNLYSRDIFYWNALNANNNRQTDRLRERECRERSASMGETN